MQADIGGTTVRVGGMAKGSGMIHPNMATMLAAITTDAAVEPRLWRDIMRRGAANSFNQVQPLLLKLGAGSTPAACLSSELLLLLPQRTDACVGASLTLKLCAADFGGWGHQHE